MRAARSKDWLRRLEHMADRPTILRSVVIDDNSILGSLEVHVDRPLTLICGPNGVGKSLLLQALWAASDSERWAASRFRDPRLKNGSVRAIYQVGDEVINCEVDLSVVEGTAYAALPQVNFVNCWIETKSYQEYFLSEEDENLLTEGYAEVKLAAAEVEQLSAITGKEYSSVSLYEIEWEEIVPFFRVQYGSDIYDSRSMGTGELCALHAWWRLRRSNEGEILFFDEPEAFLSFGSQVKIAHFIAEQCCQKKLLVVVCTHSPALIDYFGLSRSLIVNRGEHGFVLVNDAPRPRILGQLGVVQRSRVIGFVEDDLAKALLSVLLEKVDPISRSGVHIDVRGGDGEIIKVLKAVKDIALPMKFIGVFDGDQRDKAPKDLAQCSVFLPGDEPLERQLKTFIRQNQGAVGEQLGVPDLVAILAALEGLEYHDWFAGLADDIGLTSTELFKALVPLWIGYPGVRESFEVFHGEFRTAIQA